MSDDIRSYSQATEAKIANYEYLTTSHSRKVIEAVLDGIIGEDDSDKAALQRLWIGLAQYTLLKATPYYFGNDVCELLRVGAPGTMDYKLQPSDIPGTAGFFHFSVPFLVDVDDNVDVGTDERETITSRMVGISWCTYNFGIKDSHISRNTCMPPSEASGIFLELWTSADEYGGRRGGYPLTFLVWKFNESPHDLTDGQNAILEIGVDGLPTVSEFTCNQLCIFNAALLFMQQTIIKVIEGETLSVARKRAEKIPSMYAGGGLDCLRPQVVALRKTKYVKYGTQISESVPVDWSCRWLVSGHWRDQPYPSTKTIKKIWIGAVVKGPENKPFKVHAGRLNAVVR